MKMAKTTPMSIVITPSVWLEAEKERNHAPAAIRTVAIMEIPRSSLSTYCAMERMLISLPPHFPLSVAEEEARVQPASISNP